MAELTLEQQRAVALAKARLRVQNQNAGFAGLGKGDGFKRVFEGMKGMGETGLSMLTGTVATPVAGLAGIAESAIPAQTPMLLPGLGMIAPGAKSGADTVRDVSADLTYQPRTEAGQDIAGALGAIERGADKAGDFAGGDSPFAETAIKTALLGAPALLGLRGLPKTPARIPVSRRLTGPPGSVRTATPPRAIPSIDDLRAQASQAFSRAENSGVYISKGSYSQFLDDLRQTLANEGIDRGLHPASMRALRRASADEGKHLTLRGAEIIRRNINDAASSINKADQRMALIMRDKLDDYMEGLGGNDLLGGGNAQAAVQSLAEGRKLWSQVRKAEEIASLVERAKLSAPNFSASGFENALRTEFRALAKSDKRMRRYTPEERVAIRRVAQGGPVENALRMIGKAAPTGVVSGALGSGAGMMLGGPFGAVALPLLGLAGRGGATKLTKRNVSRVDELVRGGT